MSDRVRRRRRSWSVSFKQRVVAEASVPGVSVSSVARRHDLNTNLVFNWCRRFGGDETFLPVMVVDGSEAAAPGEGNDAEEAAKASRGDEIEISLSTGYRVRLRGAFDPDLVARLLRGLS